MSTARRFLPGLGDIRICLDSPGGRLSEAISIADTLAFSYRAGNYPARMIGTAIPDGARCESACAFIFMAGGFQDYIAATANIREPDRVLHVNGRLGFHAPGLRVPDGAYTEAGVNRAFATAVRSIEAVAKRRKRYRIPAPLFERFVSTPPQEMFHVTTVAEATSWMIQLAGAPRSATPRSPTSSTSAAITRSSRRWAGPVSRCIATPRLRRSATRPGRSLSTRSVTACATVTVGGCRS